MAENFNTNWDDFDNENTERVQNVMKKRQEFPDWMKSSNKDSEEDTLPANDYLIAMLLLLPVCAAIVYFLFKYYLRNSDSCNIAALCRSSPRALHPPPTAPAELLTFRSQPTSHSNFTSTSSPQRSLHPSTNERVQLPTHDVESGHSQPPDTTAVSVNYGSEAGDSPNIGGECDKPPPYAEIATGDSVSESVKYPAVKLTVPETPLLEYQYKKTIFNSTSDGQ